MEVDKEFNNYNEKIVCLIPLSRVPTDILIKSRIQKVLLELKNRLKTEINFEKGVII